MRLSWTNTAAQPAAAPAATPTTSSDLLISHRTTSTAAALNVTAYPTDWPCTVNGSSVDQDELARARGSVAAQVSTAARSTAQPRAGRQGVLIAASGRPLALSGREPGVRGVTLPAPPADGRGTCDPGQSVPAPGGVVPRRIELLADDAASRT